MILLTGGTGRLGSELRKHIECYAPSRQEFDILNPVWRQEPELIVHCAAFTDVVGAELYRSDALAVNVTGSANLTRFPIIYVSTEYVFDGVVGGYDEMSEPNPVNWYAQTKLAGEFVVRAAPKSLVIRCLFKERPFRHPAACVDQFTSGDYVDVIAPMIAECVRRFDEFKDHDTIHVGTHRKSTYDLAKQTRVVQPISVADVKTVHLPRDTSLNLSKWEMFCGH